MDREEAEKRAEESFHKGLPSGQYFSQSSKNHYIYVYLQAYDDLKAKLQEVPWTISDESMALHEFQERERPSIGERVAFLNGIHWAENRIKERV